MSNAFGPAFVAASVLAALWLAAPANAQNIRTEQVHFPRGKTGTEIQGTIRGDQIVDYVLGAQAGQTMSIEMMTSNASNYFNVSAPGASAAMHIGSTKGNNFRTVIPSSGDYQVRVYLMRNAARRNESTDYRLKVSITGGQAAKPEPDYADGLSGGPDYWEVTGVSVGDRLNMRAGPSTSERVTATFANGTKLRNLGCRMSGGQRWCRVEILQHGGWAGWVAGRYLREAAGPSSAGTEALAESDDATVGDTGFNATGKVPCAVGTSAPMGSCDFGVVRKSGRTAIVTVFLPAGDKRVLHFQNGDPVMADAPGKMTWSRRGDLLLIDIGGTERYEVPEVVVVGG